MNKICSKCKENKKENEYSTTNFKIKSGWCKLCVSKNCKESEQKRKEAIEKEIETLGDAFRKICSKCDISKSKDEFSPAKVRQRSGWCLECTKKSNTEYYKNNVEREKERSKKYAEEHKEELSKKAKEKWTNDSEYREEKLAHAKEYKEENKEKLIEKCKIYKANLSLEEKQRRLEDRRIYIDENRDELNKKRREYTKQRMATNPSLKIAKCVSASIAKFLKERESSKNNQSSWNYILFTPDELKTHIENEFSRPENLTSDGKVWMTWENWGTYRVGGWDDKDSNTWTWQLDHIIPHSTFNYTSMEDEDFKKCWVLSNLRPLSAKQNHKDGLSRVRHNIKKDR